MFLSVLPELVCSQESPEDLLKARSHPPPIKSPSLDVGHMHPSFLKLSTRFQCAGKFGDYSCMLTPWYIFALSCGQSSIRCQRAEKRTGVPMGSTCLQGSSWSWSWNQKRLSPIPVRDLEPQEEQHTVAHLAREATSKWLRWTLGRRGIRNKALPPLQQHLAQCLLSEQVKRRARRRQSLVAHLPERGARIGWRIPFIHHIPTQ